MVIVSQDKKRTTDKLELWVDLVIDNYYGVFYIDIEKDIICLGSYKTEERAEEVLQEIVTAYADFQYLKSYSNRIDYSVEQLMKKRYKHFNVYEMPEK